MFGLSTAKLVAAAIIAAVLFSAGFGAAWKIKNGIEAQTALAQAKADVTAAEDRAAAIQRSTARAMAHVQAQDAINTSVDMMAVQQRERIVTRTQTITQEIPVYVTAETDRMFPLPCGFIRLHDAAAAGIDLAADPGAVPNPAGKSDADACEIAASQAAGVINDNYGLANQWRESLIAWTAWAAQTKAGWDAYIAELNAMFANPGR